MGCESVIDTFLPDACDFWHSGDRFREQSGGFYFAKTGTTITLQIFMFCLRFLGGLSGAFRRPKKHPQKTHPHLPLSFFSSESRCFCKILRSHIWRCGCWSDTHGLCRCAAGCMRCWPRPAFSKNTDNPNICLNVNHNLPDLGPQIKLMFDQHQPDKGPLLGAEKAP